MATKKSTSKKSSVPVRDLSAQKNPKGGAQKKEGPSVSDKARGGMNALRTSKTRLS